MNPNDFRATSAGKAIRTSTGELPFRQRMRLRPLRSIARLSGLFGFSGFFGFFGPGTG
jgi:hypothetical protein